MMKLKEFTIPFVGLKEGKHQFEFHIDRTFFEAFEYEEFNSADVLVKLVLIKKATMLELGLSATGYVNVYCDLTNEPYDQKIKGKLSLIVKFGEEFNDENEELLILPHGEYQVDISQYVYEMIVLAVPAKRVHPGIADGTIGKEILEKLEQYSPREEKEQTEDGSTDPRWDTLKKLLTDK